MHIKVHGEGGVISTIKFIDGVLTAEPADCKLCEWLLEQEPDEGFAPTADEHLRWLVDSFGSGYQTWLELVE